MMLVFMFGSMVTMVPNIELTEVTAAIPIVNISLMIVQLFFLQLQLCPVWYCIIK